jgi:hypothetical protein
MELLEASVLEFEVTRCQWLMPIMLATWEVELRRMAVPSQPR